MELNIKEILKDITIKDDFYHKLDEDLGKDEKTKILIEKKEKLLTKGKEIDAYIDEQIMMLESKFSEFKETFKVDKIKYEHDIVNSFSKFNEFENELLSMFMRNNRYYEDLQKVKKNMIKILTKIYGRIASKTIAKDIKQIVENDDVYTCYEDLEYKFKLFFKNYQELAQKIKDKSYMLGTYQKFINFTRGND